MTEAIPAHTGAAVVPIAAEPGGLSPAARAAVAAGVPESTRRAYNHDAAEFGRWCAANGHAALPATPDTVTEYVAHLIHTPRENTGRPYAPASIERVIASIRTAHRAAGVQPPETKGARKVLVGYRSALSQSDDDADRQRAQANRVSAAVPTVLRRFVTELDRDTLKGKRDAALMLLGHAIAGRASELVSLNVGSIETDPDGRGVAVKVYRKKIKRWTTTKVMYGSNPTTCPVRAVLALIEALAEIGRTDGPLFVRIDQHGNVAPAMTRNGRPIGDPSGRMTPAAAASIVESAARVAGVDGRWRSHSMRRGFVTAARAAGADLVDIGRHGGWADGSKALLAYIEEDDGWSDRNPLVGIGL